MIGNESEGGDCDDVICTRFCQIYTDIHKTNNGTAAAAVSGDVVKSLRITIVMLASSQPAAQ